MHHQALTLLGALALAAPSLEPVSPKDFARKVVAPHAGRPLIVSLWATWCEPCRAEMPALLRASAEHRVELVLVSLDGRKERAAAAAFLRSVGAKGRSFIALLGDPEPFIQQVDPRWDGTVPYTLLYGPDGTIRVRLRGEQREADLRKAIAGVAVER